MLALLTKFSHLLNVDRNMNNNQLIHCAESIVESNEFYMMRLEDFQTCFNLDWMADMVNFIIDWINQ